MEKGRKEGEIEAKYAIARNLLARNYSLEDIVLITGLLETDIKALKD
jgi:hypothetical protein